MNFRESYEGHRDSVENYLQNYCESQSHKGQLQEAMAYSLLSGGKRLRPVLTLEVCRILGGDWKKALPFAAAVEMIHTYSLIHDDLPSMDDDDLRRGKATCHKAFDEATAILAGDGLLTAAFSQIVTGKLPPERLVEAVACLSEGAGEQGMVAGQALEFATNSQGEVTVFHLEQVQSLKTGALLVTACQLGAIAAGASEKEKEKVGQYAAAMGRAFQIRDDILDALGDENLLGKPVGSDKKTEKATFYTLLGEEKAQKEVERLTQEGVKALDGFEETEFLSELIKWLAVRDH